MDRLTQNPEIMGGKPCIRGKRATVGPFASGRSGEHGADRPSIVLEARTLATVDAIRSRPI